jgi:hypothetical protein
MVVTTFQIPQTIAELEESSSDESIFFVKKVPRLDMNDVQSLKSTLEGQY